MASFWSYLSLSVFSEKSQRSKWTGWRGPGEKGGHRSQGPDRGAGSDPSPGAVPWAAHGQEGHRAGVAPSAEWLVQVRSGEDVGLRVPSGRSVFLPPAELCARAAAPSRAAVLFGGPLCPLELKVRGFSQLPFVESPGLRAACSAQPTPSGPCSGAERL